MKAEHRLIFLLTVAYRRLQRAIDQETAAHDLTSAQAGVLFSLGRNDGALIGDVSQALDIVPSAMSGLADRMERAGLVKRRRDGEDGRSQRLYLTAAGKKLKRAARSVPEALLCRLGLPMQELARVRGELKRLFELTKEKAS